MVRTRPAPNARVVVAATRDILDTWGKTYALDKQTRTINQFGELTVTAVSTTIIKGDLQSGPELDDRLLERGIVHNGEAVFYTEPNQNGVQIEPRDRIKDTDSDVQWTILELIEVGEWQGTSTHQAWRCTKYS